MSRDSHRQGPPQGAQEAEAKGERWLEAGLPFASLAFRMGSQQRVEVLGHWELGGDGWRGHRPPAEKGSTLQSKWREAAVMEHHCVLPPSPGLAFTPPPLAGDHRQLLC